MFTLSPDMLSFTGVFCLFCNSILRVDSKRPTIVTIYTNQGSIKAEHFVKVCDRKNCRTHFHYSFFTRYQVTYREDKLARFFYDDALDKEYFQSSASTGFKTEFLRSFYTEMFLCPEYSFHQKTMSYNLNVATGNSMLMPKRFTEAFFQFALLELWNLFNPGVGISTLIQSHDVDINIRDLTPNLKAAFQSYYSNHRCEVSGCGAVIGFDADQKV